MSTDGVNNKSTPPAAASAQTSAVGPDARDQKISDATAILTSLVLAALAAFAAYYFLTSGFSRLDAVDIGMGGRWDAHLGGVYAYMGCVFTFVATINAIAAIFYAWDESHLPDRNWLKKQALGSLLAPIALIPIACCAALNNGRSSRGFSIFLSR